MTSIKKVRPQSLKKFREYADRAFFGQIYSSLKALLAGQGEFRSLDEISLEPKNEQRLLNAFCAAGVIEEAKKNYWKLVEKETYDVFAIEKLLSYIKTGKSLEVFSQADQLWIADAAAHEEFDTLKILANYEQKLVLPCLGEIPLKRLIETGKPQWQLSIGVDCKNIFELSALRPDLYSFFLKSLEIFNSGRNANIASALKDLGKTEILDLGGGGYDLLDEVLIQNPSAKTYLYDLHPILQKPPHTTFQGSFWNDPNELTGVASSQRFNFVVMAWILHDWSDEECILLLRKVKKILNLKDGKIFIVENEFSENKKGDLALLDFLVLAHVGGKERTRSEFESIFFEADLKIEKIIAVGKFNGFILC